jgi:adenosylcobinamide kinase/adenosylcobinamide-phosphate guanylyltransferase
MIGFIGGPAISGKSEWLIKYLPVHKTIWMGTGDTSIEPMRGRHSQLQKLRTDTSPNWHTQETTDLGRALSSASEGQIVVDSLTCWLSHVAVDASYRQSIDQVALIVAKETSQLLEHLKQHESLSRDIWIVSNEIGTSLPSPHPLERLIREANGRLNCQIASMAQEVIRMDFGIPTWLKGRPL